MSMYGSNTSLGKYAELNGIRLYYEVYGSGPSLLLIHGNGQCISDFRHQIEFLSNYFNVIVVDSRGHGNSEMGQGKLTYEVMMNDYCALLDKLELREVFLLGWSDGGIVGLLMAIKHPERVSRLAIMGANLNPAGAYHWAQEWCKKERGFLRGMIETGDTSEAWLEHEQILGLLENHPDIKLNDLHAIVAPTLVMAGDRDVIRLEHTFEIFQNIATSNLCIFPGATHSVPIENYRFFNDVVYRFFSEPFRCPDTREAFI